MPANRHLKRWVAGFGAVLLLVICLAAVTQTRVVGDTRCGPVWSPQYRDPCMSFHYERGAVAIGGVVAMVALVVVARRVERD